MQDIRFYSTLDRTLHIDLWGASTKHPDCTFEYTKEQRLQEMCFQARWTQDVKFVLEVASRMLWVGTSIELMMMAKALYEACTENDPKEIYKLYEWANIE